jgi:hypothetical protein
MSFRRNKRAKYLALTAGAAFFCSPITAFAVTDKDIQVATRTIGFIEPALAGSVPTAIVYDKNNATSRSEAEQIRALLLANGTVKAAILKPLLVEVDALDGLASFRVAFLTSGLSAQQAAVFRETSRRGIITVSTDLSCVNAAHCVVGVSSSPKVQIIVSRAARAASNAKFGSAFMMLVTEK